MKATGVILAGGRSSRMKFNKAFAEISGQPVIEMIINKFIKYFDETIIISNEPEPYAHLGPTIFPDVFPRMGPVSGIHSGLYRASYDRIFVLGCDVPFIDMKLVDYMLRVLDDYDSVVPSIDGYLQPLAAVYSQKCLPILTECLETNRVKLVRIFEDLNALILTRDVLEKFGIPEEIFLNVNDIQALHLAEQIAGRNRD